MSTKFPQLDHNNRQRRDGKILSDATESSW